MKPDRTRHPGRPKTSTLSRREPLPLAKRARAAGKTAVPLKLAARDAERMRAAMARPEFTSRLRGLLDDTLVEIAAYDNLAALCRNRSERFLGAEEAFRLYEHNWRQVDQRRMKLSERVLVERLAARYGNGVLHV
jgi:hypothetical protein